MTYDNIKEDILALGFCESIENESRFLLAINRALRLLATDFPKEKTLLLSHSYAKPSASHESLTESSLPMKRGERVAFLYHRLDGEIFFENRALPLSYGTGSYLYTAITDGALRTEGDAKIYAISLYERDTPEHLCEVNLPYTEYEISRYEPKARCIVAPPTTAGGVRILGAEVDGLCIRVPREYQGIFLVRYEKGPETVTRFTQEIEIEERLFPLFSLLCCAYFWLDDEPERSQYYMALYREGRERLSVARASYTEKVEADTLGWT